MTPAALLEELRRRGVTLSADGPYLQVDAPKDAVTPRLRMLLNERKAEIIGLLSSPIRSPTAPCLSWKLERLVCAAASNLLPQGTVLLRSGLVYDLNYYVLGWAASYLTGDCNHFRARLDETQRAAAVHNARSISLNDA